MQQQLLPSDVLDIKDVPEKKLEHFAGNGMHLPSVGFAMLVAVLALDPVTVTS